MTIQKRLNLQEECGGECHEHTQAQSNFRNRCHTLMAQYHTKESQNMFRRRQLPLGGWLIGVLIALGFFVLRMLSSTSLLWHGVTTQGVITGVGTVSCGRSGTVQEFSVQFTDHTGQVDISTISQCEYSNFNASPRASVTIVYLPDDPTEIAPPDGLLANVQFELFISILLGLIMLILLPLWIRKRSRKPSLQAL